MGNAMPHLVRSASLTHYVEVARSVGLDPYRQLAAAGIDRYALLDPDRMLPADAVAGLLEQSARAAGIEDFGLRMAASRELSNLGPLALVMREEPTLRRAIESMSRYLRLHNQALAARVEESDGLVLIRAVLDGPLGTVRQSVELVVGVLYRTLQRFIGPSWKPHGVCFSHAPPASTFIHRGLFGVAVRFNQEFDGIVCRAADLEVPLPSYDPSMAQQVRQYLDALLVQSGGNMVDDVRRLILALLPLGICSVERIAEQLGVDRRTVHHHLSRDGENYSSVLDGVRKELAMRYAQNRQRPLFDIATLLGFSSLSAFSRWFSGQFGCSVTQWRARQVP